MKTSIINYNANTLVTFKIGRGGRFNNQGHLSFVESEKSILDNNVDKIFESTRDQSGRFCAKYITDTDDAILMDAEEYSTALATGIGRLDFDGEYETYYTCTLADCGDEEAEAILDAKSYDTDSLIAAMVKIGIIDESYLDNDNEID